MSDALSNIKNNAQKAKTLQLEQNLQELDRIYRYPNKYIYENCVSPYYYYITENDVSYITGDFGETAYSNLRILISLPPVSLLQYPGSVNKFMIRIFLNENIVPGNPGYSDEIYSERLDFTTTNTNTFICVDCVQGKHKDFIYAHNTNRKFTYTRQYDIYEQYGIQNTKINYYEVSSKLNGGGISNSHYQMYQRCKYINSYSIYIYPITAAGELLQPRIPQETTIGIYGIK